MAKERIVVRAVRVLFCPDGKDHVIVHNQDYSLYVDSCAPAFLKRFNWNLDDPLGQDYQYWEADVESDTATPTVKLVKRIRKDLDW